MRCWNCGKDMPDTAKVCPHCERSVKKRPTQEEMDAVAEMLKGLDPAAREELQNLVQSAPTGDELIRSIFVGDCPKCGSADTGDCEDDPEIDNPCVGRCFKCGYVWCTECQRPLDAKDPFCPCWEEEDLPES
jgi:hypothetical protein